MRGGAFLVVHSVENRVDTESYSNKKSHVAPICLVSLTVVFFYFNCSLT
jgi:hypothetical protein